MDTDHKFLYVKIPRTQYPHTESMTNICIKMLSLLLRWGQTMSLWKWGRRRAHCPSIRWYMSKYEAVMEWYWQRKTCPSRPTYHFVHHKSHIVTDPLLSRTRANSCLLTCRRMPSSRCGVSTRSLQVLLVDVYLRVRLLNCLGFCFENPSQVVFTAWLRNRRITEHFGLIKRGCRIYLALS
jgi:hypothetical protein